MTVFGQAGGAWLPHPPLLLQARAGTTTLRYLAKRRCMMLMVGVWHERVAPPLARTLKLMVAVSLT